MLNKIGEFADIGTGVCDLLLSSIDYNKDSQAGKLYPFKVRCGIVQRRPPRHKFFEWILDLGRGDVERVLKYESFNQKPPINLIFVLPERWMGVGELYQFMSRFKRHPEAEKIERVDILTASPMLISSFYKEQIVILSWEDDSEY